MALGNIAESAAVPYLEAALCGDPDPVVRGHAAWALALCSVDTPQSALRSALESETDPVVVKEIEAALDAQGVVRESASLKPSE